MKIKNLLVSQPAPPSIERSPFYEITQKHNVKITFFPFIKVEGVSLREFRSQRQEILDHTAVIFTSRTTIEHFFRICEEARITIPESMKYICNTEAVALYLQKYIVYRKRKIFFADGSFSGLIELIMKHREERMLLTLSEPYNTDLPSAMERLKLNVDRVTLSRAVSNDLSGIDPSAYDLIILYTPAEISALAAAFGVEKLPAVATFGNGTTRAAIEAGIPVRIMAPTPQVPSMAKAVDLYIEKIEAGEEVPTVILPQCNKTEEFLQAQEARIVRKVRGKRPESAGSKSAANGSRAKAAAKPAAKSAAKTSPPAAARNKK